MSSSLYVCSREKYGVHIAVRNTEERFLKGEKAQTEVAGKACEILLFQFSIPH